MARPFFVGEKFRIIDSNNSNFYLVSSNSNVMSVADRDILAVGPGLSAIVVYDGITNEKVISFNVVCLSYQAPPSFKKGVGRFKNLGLSNGFYLAKILSNFKAPVPGAPEVLEVIPDLYYKTQYLVVEVFDHWGSDGATITEIGLTDKNNNVIPYTVTDIYDSSVSGTPSYWNSEKWGSFNLFDTEEEYLDAVSGELSSTLFLSGTAPLSENYARFLIDLKSEYDEFNFSLTAGSPEKRIPKFIQVYAVENSFDYNQHLVSRDDAGLAFLGGINLWPRNTVLVKNRISVTKPRAKSSTGEDLPQGLFGSGTVLGGGYRQPNPESTSDMSYGFGSGNQVKTISGDIVQDPSDPEAELVSVTLKTKRTGVADPIEEATVIPDPITGVAHFNIPQRDTDPDIEEIIFTPTLPTNRTKTWKMLKIQFGDVGRTTTTDPNTPADEIYIGYGVADYGLQGYGL